MTNASFGERSERGEVRADWSCSRDGVHPAHDRILGEKAKEPAATTARRRKFLDRLEKENEARRLGRWPAPELRVIRGGRED